MNVFHDGFVVLRHPSGAEQVLECCYSFAGLLLLGTDKRQKLLDYLPLLKQILRNLRDGEQVKIRGLVRPALSRLEMYLPL
jgi:hypothetical protein